MTQDEPVRLLLAEDQVMIREALAALLSFEATSRWWRRSAAVTKC